MSTLPTLPEIGRIVEITRGRDRGVYGVVVRQDSNRFVYVADGRVRKAEHPKKKNVLHVKSTPEVARAVEEELRNFGKVTNATVRHVIRQYESALLQTTKPAGVEQVGLERGGQNGEG